jgi:hypothetical protein
MSATQGPPIEWKEPELSLEYLASLNKYRRVERAVEKLLASGELQDYDSELATSLRFASKIAAGVVTLAGKPQQ